jgi:hypothetical protein
MLGTVYHANNQPINPTELATARVTYAQTARPTPQEAARISQDITNVGGTARAALLEGIGGTMASRQEVPVPRPKTPTRKNSTGSNGGGLFD